MRAAPSGFFATPVADAGDFEPALGWPPVRDRLRVVFARFRLGLRSLPDRYRRGTEDGLPAEFYRFPPF